MILYFTVLHFLGSLQRPISNGIFGRNVCCVRAVKKLKSDETAAATAADNEPMVAETSSAAKSTSDKDDSVVEPMETDSVAQ